eukprot:594255_1
MNEFVRFSNIFLLQSTFCMFFNGSVIIRLNDEYDTQHYTVNVRCDTMHLLHVNLNSIDPCGCDSRCLLGLIIQMTIEVSYDPLCTFTSHLSIIKCDVQCNAYIDLSDHVQCMYSEESRETGAAFNQAKQQYQPGTHITSTDHTSSE